MASAIGSMTDEQILSAYRAEGVSEIGARIQLMALRHLQQQGVEPQPGALYIIGGSEPHDYP